MKDMETDIAKNTEISAVLPRGDRSDVLLGNYDSFDICQIKQLWEQVL